jgi:uncharacterized membrane protein YraQ (UPF0718 family)
VVTGLRKQNVGISGALAFFLGNPVLNPATLLFIGFVLGWQFVGLRIAAGIILVFFVSYMAARFADRLPAQKTPPIDLTLAPIEEPDRSLASIVAAFFKEIWIEVYSILPGYIITVLLLGAARAWLFPPQLTIHASGIGAIVALSAIGTAFVIPTAGEVPIVQTLLHAGMGIGPAVALLVTLPAISIPSLFIVRGAFPKRVLAFVTACILALGIVAGVFAMFFMRA